MRCLKTRKVNSKLYRAWQLATRESVSPCKPLAKRERELPFLFHIRVAHSDAISTCCKLTALLTYTTALNYNAIELLSYYHLTSIKIGTAIGDFQKESEERVDGLTRAHGVGSSLPLLLKGRNSFQRAPIFLSTN